MPRFLALLRYTTEGSKVLLKEKVTVRETFARKAIESVGGKVESIYFTASGEYHIAMTAEYPDARHGSGGYCFDGIYWGRVQVQCH